MKICCDSTFLIDLSRDRRKAKTAYSELMSRGVELVTTFLNVGELLAGVPAPADQSDKATVGAWALIQGFSVLGVERSHLRKTGGIYAALHKRLRSIGLDIPASDKIIIAIALAHDINTILTRDVDHFGRVPGIDVISY